MASIKRSRSSEKGEIVDDIQASNSDVENSKKLQRTTDQALTIQFDNVRSDFAIQRKDDEKIAYSLEEKESKNTESVKYIGSNNDHIYNPSDFAIGDVIWAKCGKKFPFWPAIVIDPSSEAPPAVLKARPLVSSILCVMFYGHSKSSRREYGWIKAGMAFPFDAYIHRFEGQTKLYGSNMCNFQEAINEAIASVSADVATILDSESSLQLLTESIQLCDRGGSDQTWFSDNLDRNVISDDKVVVVCNSVQGIYDPSLNLAGCSCASCDAERYTLNAWEKHTGSRAKKWKTSIRVHESNQTLSDWIEGNAADGLNRNLLEEQQLFAFLDENYEPVHVRWTIERCAICRWIVDWDYNKIIICNICHVAVHQKCYGVNGSRTLASWVCRACKTPEVKRECCLCPVKGGALKPTDIEPLWVHVMCAWFRPEISFTNKEEMEPAIGLLKIPGTLFTKVCVICKQVHGSCMQCYKCTTYFHATCASRAGYCMEVHCIEKNKTKKTNWIAYCAVHREPRATNLLAIKTPDQMLSNISLLPEREFHEQCSNGSITITTADTAAPLNSLSVDGYESKEMSAARCRIYKRSSIKRTGKDSVLHRSMGPSHHSLDDIRCLSLHKGTHDENKDFYDLSTLEEILKYLKMTENYNACFGKSRIHGWGLFARRNIQNGEMIMEYCGEKLRRCIADLREVRYQSEGKDCYFFTIGEEIVIDATNKGNMSRLLNHSCMPNCCARIVTVGTEDNIRIVLTALSNISTGEEITCDYLSPDVSDKAKAPCLCNAPECKKFVK